MRAVFPQVGDSIFFCLPRLTSICGEQPFGHTKSKASEYEHLILASTPGKSLRRFRKDNNHLEKFDTSELLQMTKESVNGQRQSTLYFYVCMY